MLSRIPLTQALACFTWLLFLLSPFFTTNILEYFIASDLLAFTLALAASAWLYISNPFQHQRNSSTLYWLLAGLLTPAFLILLTQQVPHPWAVYKFSLYLTAVFLIFSLSRNGAVELLNSPTWFTMLGIAGNLYVTVALLQMFQLLPEYNGNLFALWSHASRFSGALLQPNLSSLFLDIIIISLWIQAAKCKNYWPWMLASCLPLANVLVSNSRSGILLLAISTFFLIFHMKEKKHFLTHLVTCFFMALLLAWIWNNQVSLFTNEQLTIGSRLYSGGFSDRISLWLSAIYLWTEHPLLGIGYGNFASYFAEAQAHTLQHYPNLGEIPSASYWVHNAILDFFLSGGVISGVAFLYILLCIFRRIKGIIQTDNALQHPSFSSGLIVAMIFIHGMVSISFFQGFFLSLLGLYLAGLFPASHSEHAKPSIFHSLYFIPALYAGLLYTQFLSTQIHINAVFDENPDNPRFIEEVSKAIDNPWLARAGLEYLLANMELTPTPAYQWINVYPYIFHAWQLSQDPAGLRRLILQAHLSNNALSERYWGRLFLKAYPSNPWCATLQQHLAGGHQAHEPLKLNIQ